MCHGSEVSLPYKPEVKGSIPGFSCLLIMKLKSNPCITIANGEMFNNNNIALRFLYIVIAFYSDRDIGYKKIQEGW